MTDRLEPPRFTWERAITDSDLSSNAKLVALTLATWFSKQESVAFPSVETLTRKTSLSRATVQRALGELDPRFLSRQVANGPGSTGRRTTRYVAVMPEGPLCEAPGASQGGPISEGHQSGTDVPGGTDVVTPSSDSPPARPRQRNPLFDTLARVCDINVDELTPPQAKRVGTALALIRKAREAAGKELRVGDLEARAARYRRKYPQASLTPTALSAHWAELGPGQTPPSDLIPGDVMGGTR